MLTWGFGNAIKFLGVVLIFTLYQFEPGESARHHKNKIPVHHQNESSKGTPNYEGSSQDYFIPLTHRHINGRRNSIHHHHVSGSISPSQTTGGYVRPCKPGLLPRDRSNTSITYKKQSPIDIQPRISNVKYCSKLKFINHNIPQTFNISNTGVYIEFIWAGDPESRPRITHGPLKGTYELQNVHLHTSPNDPSNSSEHAIFGKKYDAEVHAVYSYEGYSESELAHKRDAFFVIALLVKICSPAFQAKLGPSRVLNRALNVPDILEESGSSYVWDSKLPLTWSKAVPSMPAYLYDGSSTTPPYRENFVFYVVEEPFCISPDILEFYRSLKDEYGNPLRSSVRGLQDRHRRPILRLHRK